MTKRQGPPSQGWKTFLRNHAAGIASLDLFVVRTISFKLLCTEPAAAACEWLSLEHLAHGSEWIGGMVVLSAQVRKLLKTCVSIFDPIYPLLPRLKMSQKLSLPQSP
jgi:hypothetical protein